MENKEKVIGYLKQTLSGIIAGSQQHFMHAIINKKRGYNKLADEMMAEIDEEKIGAEKFINRIIELGGTPDIEHDKWPIYMDIEEQIKVELEEQTMALEALNKIIMDIEEDDVTKQIFQEYLLDETNHTELLKRQTSLIESIGLQNYLASKV